MSLSRGETIALIVQRAPFFEHVLRPAARLGELGLDSLDLVELMMVVDELFGVRLEIDEFDPGRTVGELAASIAARAQEVPQS
jgi:acyl carrier protein